MRTCSGHIKVRGFALRFWEGFLGIREFWGYLFVVLVWVIVGIAENMVG